MRRTAALVLAVTLLAACGSSGSSKPASGTTATTDASAAASYIAAAKAGLVASTPKADRAGLESDLGCIAGAIVNGIGVARLRAAGVTLDKLRDPNFQPPDQISKGISQAERLALGAHLQTCHISRLVALGAQEEFATGSPTGSQSGDDAARCFGRGFDGAAARPMIAGFMLNDLDAASATRLARLFVGCVDTAPLVASSAGIKLSAAEDRCVQLASRTDTAFIKFLADEFRGVKTDESSGASRFGLKVIACLTPADVAKLASGG